MSNSVKTTSKALNYNNQYTEQAELDQRCDSQLSRCRNDITIRIDSKEWAQDNN